MTRVGFIRREIETEKILEKFATKTENFLLRTIRNRDSWGVYRLRKQGALEKAQKKLMKLS